MNYKLVSILMLKYNKFKVRPKRSVTMPLYTYKLLVYTEGHEVIWDEKYLNGFALRDIRNPLADEISILMTPGESIAFNKANYAGHKLWVLWKDRKWFAVRSANVIRNLDLLEK